MRISRIKKILKYEYDPYMADVSNVLSDDAIFINTMCDGEYITYQTGRLGMQHSHNHFLRITDAKEMFD